MERDRQTPHKGNFMGNCDRLGPAWCSKANLPTRKGYECSMYSRGDASACEHLYRYK